MHQGNKDISVELTMIARMLRDIPCHALNCSTWWFGCIFFTL